MEGLLVSRSVLGSNLALGKRSPSHSPCQASWSPIHHGSQSSRFSPFFTFGESPSTVPSTSSSRLPLDGAGACQSSGSLHDSRGHHEETALVHVQKEGDVPTSQFRKLSEEMAMGLVLHAASGTGWTTGSGLKGPSNLYGLEGGQLTDETIEHPWPMLSKSPRRRMRVAFTCNVCGERTTRAINPHAYTDGTVFVQCGGCNIFHKLVDNLKLFHELKGSLFPNTVMYGKQSFADHEPYDFLGLDDNISAT